MKINKTRTSILLLLVVFFVIVDFSFSLSTLNRRKNIRARNALKKFSNSDGFDPKTFNCNNPYLITICGYLTLELNEKYKVNVVQTYKDGEQLIKVELPEYKLTQLKFLQSIKWVADPIKLLDISIPKSDLILIYSSKNIVAHLGAQIDFLETKAVNLDIIGMKVDKDFTVLASFYSNLSMFPNMINKLRESKGQPALMPDNPITWFQNSSIAILFASNTVDFSKLPAEFKPSYFNTLKIQNRNGAHAAVEAILSFKNDQGNHITQFLKDHFFPKEVKISAIIDESKVEIYCGITEKTFKKTNITLNKAGLVIIFEYQKPLPEVGVEAEITIPTSAKSQEDHNMLTLFGRFTLSPVDVGFQFGIKNIWVNAFGLKRFSFGNIFINSRFSYASGIPTMLDFGGELAIGVSCYVIKEGKAEFVGRDYCIRVQAQVGISTISPTDNYYHGELDSISFKTIALAFAGDASQKESIKVPEFLEKLISFQMLKASFSLKEQNLPTIKIEKGLRISGKATSFSQQCEFNLIADINKTQPTFSFSLSFSKPFKVGKAFALSAMDITKGPLMKFNMGDKVTKNNTLFSGEFEAKVKILKIETGAKVIFGTEGLSFEVEGKLLNAFDAKFHVESQYKVSAQTKIKTTAHGILKIHNRLGDIIKQAGELALESLKSMKVAVDIIHEEKKKHTGPFGKAMDWWDKHVTLKIKKFKEKLKHNFTSLIDRIGVERIKEFLDNIALTIDLFKVEEVTFNMDVDVYIEKKSNTDKNSRKIEVTVKALIFKKYRIIKTFNLNIVDDTENVEGIAEVLEEEITEAIIE